MTTMTIFQILPGLYIGNFRDSKDCRQLDVNRITHILSIHDDAKKLFKVRKNSARAKLVRATFWERKIQARVQVFLANTNWISWKK